jgi:hypothetical protein
MSRGPSFASLSIVIVIKDALPELSVFDSMLRACEHHAAQIDLVLVANGVPDEIGVPLKRLVGRLPDTTCLFLANKVDPDLAWLTGIDNAIGDWVLLPGLTPAGIAAIGTLVDATARGYDVVVGQAVNGGVPDRSFHGCLATMFFMLYGRLTGVNMLTNRAVLCLLSRPAALHLATSGRGEMLWRTATVGSGFPGTVVTLAGDMPRLPRRGFSASWSKAMRVLLTATSAPLRMASLFSLGACVLSLLYSAYVVAIYLFSPVIERGWTTLSLQISGMMFLFSIVLLLLSEYIIQISHNLGGMRRVVPIVRELRSPLSRIGRQLNVVDEEGHYVLGAPVTGTTA